MFRDRTRLNITAVLEVEGPFYEYEDASLDFPGLPNVWYTLLRYFNFQCCMLC